MEELIIDDNNEFEYWNFDNDYLFNLVKAGKKTATCYLSSGEKSISKFSILQSLIGEQLKLQTLKAYKLRFNEVTSNFAKLEGEGDLSLDYWKSEHKMFFSKELQQNNIMFNENIEIIFEIFKVV